MDTKKKKEETKNPRGRPVKNVIEPIDATPEEIARAISLAGHKKIKSKFRVGRKTADEVC